MNPLKYDPTRTTTITRKFVSDLNARFNRLNSRMWDLIVVEDAFGITEQTTQMVLHQRRRWEFETSPRKLQQFKDWLQTQVDAELLEVDSNGDPWTAEYVTSSYKKAVLRSYSDVHAETLAEDAKFYQGTKARFLQDSFASPTSVQRIKLLNMRSFEQLKGVTNQMAQRLGTILADGLAHGRSASFIANQIWNSIGSIDKPRARRIARTEIIHAYAEGQLDAYEKLEIEELEIMAEWSTAGDDKVCDLCGPLEGVVIPISEARGMIPRHPNCRCSWRPANVGEKSKGQKKTQARIEKAIARSLRAERPNEKTVRGAQRKSSWVGADMLPTPSD